VRRRDGALGVERRAGRPDAAPVLAAGDAAGGPLLVEADGQPIGLWPDAPLQRILGLAVHPLDDGSLLLRHGTDGPFLSLGEGTVRLEAGKVTPFRLETVERPAAGRLLLARIPETLAFDPPGLSRLFAAGDASLLPVMEALLPLLTVEAVRQAWSLTPSVPARDVFHPLVRRESRERAGRFGGYTAERLRAEIEQHGWSVGEESYGAPRIMEAGRGRLTIGRYCSLADPRIILGNHGTRTGSTYPFVDLWAEWPGAAVGMSDHVARDVVIGNDVWIGVDSVLLPGAIIGDGAVVGAGCVVRGSVPPYAICVGNPGVVKGYRFAPPVIERLLALRWWDWPAARVDRYLPLILSEDVEVFLDAAEAEDRRERRAITREALPA